MRKVHARARIAETGMFLHWVGLAENLPFPQRVALHVVVVSTEIVVARTLIDRWELSGMRKAQALFYCARMGGNCVFLYWVGPAER
jgi:hypothetical protein